MAVLKTFVDGLERVCEGLGETVGDVLVVGTRSRTGTRSISERLAYDVVPRGDVLEDRRKVVQDRLDHYGSTIGRVILQYERLALLFEGTRVVGNMEPSASRIEVLVLEYGKLAARMRSTAYTVLEEERRFWRIPTIEQSPANYNAAAADTLEVLNDSWEVLRESGPFSEIVRFPDVAQQIRVTKDRLLTEFEYDVDAT